MAHKAKIHASANSVVLSISHIYILTRILKVSRLRGDFIQCAESDGFHLFIDMKSKDPFAKELRYLVDFGYVMTEDIPRSQSGTNHCKLYHLTEKGFSAINRAMEAYEIIIQALAESEK